MTNKLVALLDGIEIGRVQRDARGRIKFVYDDEWRKAPDAYPLSLSMPLGAKEHGRTVTEAFLWGLLPDNERCSPAGPPNSKSRHATSSRLSPMSARIARAPFNL